MSVSSKRLYSLDVFRGMTISLMILVNIPGSWSFIYAPFKHADWHGCTPTDLVFPFFLFIVGSSMAFSFQKFNYQLKTDSFFKLLERTFLIFAIGFFLNNFPFFNRELSGNSFWENILQVALRLVISMTLFLGFIRLIKIISQKIEQQILSKTDRLTKTILFTGFSLLMLILIFGIPALLYQLEFFNKDFSKIRIMGVFQRIALAYGLAALIVLSIKPRLIYILGAFLLLFYWFIMWFYGGNDPYSLEFNFGRQIDLWVLGENHLWHGKEIAFDPEGLFSTIPSVVTVLIGFLVGKFIHDHQLEKGKWLIKLFGVGFLFIATALLWDTVFPINKSLWTSSYVLFTGGLAMMFLALLYWIIDIKNQSRWFTFFNVFGVNPLFAFVLHVLWVKIITSIIKWNIENDKTTNGYSWLYSHLFQPLAGDFGGSFLFAITHIFFFYLLLLILFKRKIFIKI